MSPDPSRLPLRIGSVAAKGLGFVSVRIIWNPSSRDAARFRGNKMATAPQLNPYRCEQCGTPDIVAVPLLYQQGTRTYSSSFGWGSSQSHSARAASPPHPRSYMRPLLSWGFAIFFFFFWGLAGSSAVLTYPKTATTTENAVAIFIFLGVACLGGMVLNLRRIARYNREAYPRLHWDWSHTYICQRCGSRSLISS